MRLVTVRATCGPSPLFRLKDADTGIVYPNLLNSEQIRSPSVQEAACTYIGMKMHEQREALILNAMPPLMVNLFDFIGWPGCRTGRTSANEPEPQAIATAGERALIDEINQLKRELAHLQERNGRQARIIKAVQGAVRGDVQ